MIIISLLDMGTRYGIGKIVRTRNKKLVGQADTPKMWDEKLSLEGNVRA